MFIAEMALVAFIYPPVLGAFVATGASSLLAYIFYKALGG